MEQKKETVRTMSEEAKERISGRLSCLENLYFPRALESTVSLPSQRKAIFRDLLSRDVALFLERYGSKLTGNELSEFDSMKDDYEINWHMKRLRSIMSPSEEELRMRSVTVKNRRRAYLDRLVCGGHYFSEEAMREREPYLHHEYVGKFQDQSGRRMARPGERWSETLMRRCDEAALVAKIRGEQQRMGVPERDWRDLNEAVVNDDSLSNPGRVSLEQTVSAEELEDRMDQFTYIMQQKFLLGEDQEHLDYSKIDNDETLDDHWQREANIDAEERYFADD
ncbi:hypothetical protein ACSQ67_007413 [Phaseolus vulgaris]